jgi:hypothetical protein
MGVRLEQRSTHDKPLVSMGRRTHFISALVIFVALSGKDLN